ncbi:MAG: hypothetical protein H7322_18390 [Ramlibacter sp.]|nr:hypothetical protein [Ramlibacter sp.]
MMGVAGCEALENPAGETGVAVVDALQPRSLVAQRAIQALAGGFNNPESITAG